MEDAEVYGWALVWAYHAVWLQQIENDTTQWMDVDAKLEVRRMLVWHADRQASRAKPVTKGGGGTGKKNS